MKLLIESASETKDIAAATEICRQVFEREFGMNRAPGSDPLRGYALLARDQPSGKPMGTLTLVDTSGDRDLHDRYGLAFPASAKVARYTRLAVLPPYRGRGISLRLLHEARRRFVLPEKYDYSWLLFDAERAASSTLSTLLDFVPGNTVFASEWGRTRAMVKRETAEPASLPSYWVGQGLVPGATQRL